MHKDYSPRQSHLNRMEHPGVVTADMMPVSAAGVSAAGAVVPAPPIAAKRALTGAELSSSLLDDGNDDKKRRRIAYGKTSAISGSNIDVLAWARENHFMIQTTRQDGTTSMRCSLRRTFPKCPARGMIRRADADSGADYSKDLGNFSFFQAAEHEHNPEKEERKKGLPRMLRDYFHRKLLENPLLTPRVLVDLATKDGRLTEENKHSITTTQIARLKGTVKKNLEIVESGEIPKRNSSNRRSHIHSRAPIRVNVRLAVAQDMPNLVHSAVACAFETEEYVLDQKAANDGVIAVIAGNERAAKGFYVVAETEGDCIFAGSLLVLPEFSDWHNSMCWWLRSVYVIPEMRKQTVFRQLFSFCVQLARERNVLQVRLHVNKKNMAARGICQSTGLSVSNSMIMECDPLKPLPFEQTK